MRQIEALLTSGSQPAGAPPREERPAVRAGRDVEVIGADRTVLVRVSVPGLDPPVTLLEAWCSRRARSPLRVHVAGELCAYSAPALVDGLERLSGDDLVIDLWSVAFVDSTGISSLLALRRRWEASGHALVLANPSAAVCRIVTILRFDDILYGSVRE